MCCLLDITCSTWQTRVTHDAYLGKAVPLFTDHKPTLWVKKNRILRAGYSVNYEGRIDGNLNLSRCISDLKYKKGNNLKPE